jgi:hypothetical protein
MTKYRCQKAGQPVKSLSGSPLACGGCDGEITLEGNQVTAPAVKGGLWSYPRKAVAGFDCPATITSTASSELVEVIA